MRRPLPCLFSAEIASPTLQAGAVLRWVRAIAMAVPYQVDIADLWRADKLAIGSDQCAMPASRWRIEAKGQPLDSTMEADSAKQMESKWIDIPWGIVAIGHC